MTSQDYENLRSSLLANNCQELLLLEQRTTETLVNAIYSQANNIKRDFDKAFNLMPFWSAYAPVQRGYKPRGEACPWGEVGEKVVEGYLYSLLPQVFNEVAFPGIPYGHDVRFSTPDAFIHIDAKSTGPTDDLNEVVSSPNQVTGDGAIFHGGEVRNNVTQMRGSRVSRDFQPELAPFVIDDGVVKPVLTYYLKIAYTVFSPGNQPLWYLELICVPNGLILFAQDGPRLIDNVQGMLTPGKDEQRVVRKRTRVKLNPLSQLGQWRCTKIFFDGQGRPYIQYR
ncbi:BglI family type II restriction endonuclease [Vibrio parahaemolyticus]|uniref:BglI family type II restriction endonuclease n=1 Tax=Vibrio harveyi group TaxID=717610 RepID=UPI001F38E9CA|nr:BglI family type II restriction endonuclease [Vibrio parahaemolyticus]EJC6826989.1 BglI family type II restriction endonuclease [Vibrio parahaemolyticus]EJF9963480.1 BglI family type II restriction endonuclease [Vibrio parahaemolyticus]EJF9986906.1 BglI family type II restriction endonuclease [Vibrio parahaemolyticus]EJG0071401.1 BglI family type II restriction endonuclease [Vibrio parahaemolyticus]EJG0076130.1 BglI family type II restriction endonuclease [Vibrio parahaemolyticus]